MSKPEDSISRGRRISRESATGLNPYRFRPQSLPCPEPSQKLLICLSGQVSDSTSNEQTTISIKDVEYVASYNWLDESKPAVLIPGVPPAWLPLPRTIKLEADTVDHYDDYNAARYSRQPLEPAVRSVLLIPRQHPTVSFKLFCCSDTLTSLLCYIKGERRTFQFRVDLVGDTMFLVKLTTSSAHISDTLPKYSQNFAKACTTMERIASDSTSYQRIISYELAGLRCLVRHGYTGYLPDKVTDTNEDSKQTSEDTRSVGMPPNNRRDAATEPQPQEQATDTERGRKKMYGGSKNSRYPHCSIFDLETQPVGNHDQGNLDKFLPGLWINQSPNLVLVFHSHGVFRETDIQIHDVRDQVQKWEQENQGTIRELKSLLDYLRNTAKTLVQGALEVRRTDNGPMEIWTVPEGWSALSENSKQCWMNDTAEAGNTGSGIEIPAWVGKYIDAINSAY